MSTITMFLLQPRSRGRESSRGAPFKLVPMRSSKAGLPVRKVKHKTEQGQHDLGKNEQHTGKHTVISNSSSSFSTFFLPQCSEFPFFLSSFPFARTSRLFSPRLSSKTITNDADVSGCKVLGEDEGWHRTPPHCRRSRSPYHSSPIDPIPSWLGQFPARSPSA